MRRLTPGERSKPVRGMIFAFYFPLNCICLHQCYLLLISAIPRKTWLNNSMLMHVFCKK